MTITNRFFCQGCGKIPEGGETLGNWFRAKQNDGWIWTGIKRLCGQCRITEDIETFAVGSIRRLAKVDLKAAQTRKKAYKKKLQYWIKRDQKINKLLDDGKTTTIVAKQFGVTRGRIWQIRTRYMRMKKVKGNH